MASKERLLGIEVKFRGFDFEVRYTIIPEEKPCDGNGMRTIPEYKEIHSIWLNGKNADELVEDYIQEFEKILNSR